MASNVVDAGVMRPLWLGSGIETKTRYYGRSCNAVRSAEPVTEGSPLREAHSGMPSRHSPAQNRPQCMLSRSRQLRPRSAAAEWSTESGTQRWQGRMHAIVAIRTPRDKAAAHATSSVSCLALAQAHSCVKGETHRAPITDQVAERQSVALHAVRRFERCLPTSRAWAHILCSISHYAQISF